MIRKTIPNAYVVVKQGRPGSGNTSVARALKKLDNKLKEEGFKKELERKKYHVTESQRKRAAKKSAIHRNKLKVKSEKNYY